MHEVASCPPGSTADRPVTLTEKAIEMVKEIVARDGLNGQALRVSVNDGGCSGMSYALDFSPAPQDGDLTLEQEGVTVYVASDALAYLEGTTIDYVTGLHRAGFRFVNPQANRTCGCGESFSV
jgi:iron-sulfur cluster assembly accessory protein